PDQRNAQQRRVEILAVEGLNKDAAAGIIGALANLGVYGVALSLPGLDRAAQIAALDAAHSAIERHPGHQGGMGVTARRPADFPDAGIGLRPAAFEMIEQHFLDALRIVLGLDVVQRRQIERVHDLAEDVELLLGVGGIADADRRAALEAGEPGELVLVEAPLTADPIHDLDFGR